MDQSPALEGAEVDLQLALGLYRALTESVRRWQVPSSPREALNLADVTARAGRRYVAFARNGLSDPLRAAVERLDRQVERAREELALEVSRAAARSGAVSPDASIDEQLHALRDVQKPAKRALRLPWPFGGR